MAVLREFVQFVFAQAAWRPSASELKPVRERLTVTKEQEKPAVIDRQLNDDLYRAARKIVSVDGEIGRSQSDSNTLQVDWCQIADLIVGQRSDPVQNRLDHRSRVVPGENILG